MFLIMVCEGLTFNNNGIEITELSPVCLEGRVIYAASYDPAVGRQQVAAAPKAITWAPEARPSRNSRPPSNSSETRLFVFGIAAGVIAAMALGQHTSGS
jgi:hypothetical protein